jgi:hypothetical protein
MVEMLVVRERKQCQGDHVLDVTAKERPPALHVRAPARKPIAKTPCEECGGTGKRLCDVCSGMGEVERQLPQSH